MRQLVSALRLMGPGRVSVGRHWTRYEQPYFGIRGSSYGEVVVPGGNPTLKLSTVGTAKDEILGLMSQVTDLNGDDPLATALRSK